MGGEGWDLAGAMDIDSSGNIYAGGIFSGRATFGAHTLFSNEVRNHFICKISEAGTIVGARHLSDGMYNTLDGVFCRANEVFILGTYSASLSIPPFTLTSESKRNTSLYLAMLDTDLKPLRLTETATGDRINIFSCRGDREGNMYVSGCFKNWISIEDSIVYSVDRQDHFVLKLNPEGHVDWVRTWQIKNPDDRSYLQVSNHKELVIACTYEKKLVAGDTVIYSSGRKDVIVAKLDSKGNELWMQSLGGDFDEIAGPVAIDTSGNIYLSVTFNHSLILQDTVYDSHGEQDLLLVKMDPSGEIVWTKHWGSNQPDEMSGICLDSFGYLFILGSFRGRMVMDQDTVTSLDRQSDIFLAKFNQAGDCLWWENLSGNSEDLGHAIQTNYLNNICIIGSFRDDLATNQEVIASRGITDVFLVKFIDPCNIHTFDLPGIQVLCENSNDTLDAGGGFLEYDWNLGNGDNRYLEISKPGYYFIEVTDQFGCIKRDSIQVLMDSIRIDFLVINEYLPDGQNGSIHTSVYGISDHFSYLWDTGDTTPDLMNLVQGSYSLVVSDRFGCSAFVEIPVGLDVSSGILSLSNFPNPFSETTNIYYSIPEDMWVEISLFDINGKKLLTLVNVKEKSGNHQIEWNRNDLASGVYYLQIRVKDGILSRKIVIANQ